MNVYNWALGGLQDRWVKTCLGDRFALYLRRGAGKAKKGTNTRSQTTFQMLGFINYIIVIFIIVAIIICCHFHRHWMQSQSEFAFKPRNILCIAKTRLIGFSTILLSIVIIITTYQVDTINTFECLQYYIHLRKLDFSLGLVSISRGYWISRLNTISHSILIFRCIFNNKKMTSI